MVHDMWFGNTKAKDSTDAPEPKYVVARTKSGPYLDERGDPQADAADAYQHPSRAMAEIIADHMTKRQDHLANPWMVMPSPVAEDPDDDAPYDAEKGNADYARLGRDPRRTA